METSLIILIVIYLGVGYIATLILDIGGSALTENPQKVTSLLKLFSIIAWPIIMVGYLFTDLTKH